jgi:ribonuclease HI
MHEALRIITDVTGCNVEQAQVAIAGLMEQGWSAPAQIDKAAVEPTVVASSLADMAAGTVLTAHTDGACSGNPGPGGWAVVFSVEGAVVGEFSGGEPGTTTSNRMELTAVREAIQRAPLGAALEILTDSKNVVGWLSDGWRRKNPDIAKLCGEIDGLSAERAATGGGPVNFRHVRGHNRDALNERADELATGAIERARRAAA